MYTCPMHPEIKQENSGKCPKCGMDLVKEESIKGKGGSKHNGLENNYTPLIVIISLILLVVFTIELRDATFILRNFISNFMIGFFLTFAGFKLIDLKGFAEGYSTYDLLAQKLPVYGYIYPILEFSFGLGMILFGDNPSLLIAEIIVMSFSGLGVLNKLIKKEKFQCVCLGTFLKVPLTKITLIEDFGMAILAVLILILN